MRVDLNIPNRHVFWRDNPGILEVIKQVFEVFVGDPGVLRHQVQFVRVLPRNDLRRLLKLLEQLEPLHLGVLDPRLVFLNAVI